MVPILATLCYLVVNLVYCGNYNHLNAYTTCSQGRSQPHSSGWARVPLSSFFPQILIDFSYFSSNFTYFLPHFGSLGGRVAHLERPWLRHCLFSYKIIIYYFIELDVGDVLKIVEQFRSNKQDSELRIEGKIIF